MSRGTRPIAALSLLLIPLLGGFALAAQDGPAKSWSEVKCERYREAWSQALARRGRQGIGAEFIARHEAFLASGCSARGDVCPRSRQEFELADTLTVAAMNFGTASTFLPFACRS